MPWVDLASDIQELFAPLNNHFGPKERPWLGLRYFRPDTVEEARARAREWRRWHPERHSANARCWERENAAKRSAHRREKYHANLEANRAKAREYKRKRKALASLLT